MLSDDGGKTRAARIPALAGDTGQVTKGSQLSPGLVFKKYQDVEFVLRFLGWMLARIRTPSPLGPRRR